MNSREWQMAENQKHQRLTKRPTGIPGLDHMTRGGLLAGGATLVMGQPGDRTVLYGDLSEEPALRRFLTGA